MANANCLSHTSPVLQLERFLTGRLAATVEKKSFPDVSRDLKRPTEDEELLDDVVQFAIRYDSHWLKCQPCRIQPLMTIMGVYEEDGDPHQLIQLKWCPPLPSSQYQRHLSNNLSAERNIMFPKGAVSSDAKMLHWIDFRILDNESLPKLSTRADIWHFLSRLLGNDKLASPWHRTETSSENVSHVDSDMVFVILPRMDRQLAEFRVSDACPSWFFHGFALLDGLESSQQDLFQGIKNHGEPPRTSLEPAVVYMYKRLQPRPLLSVHHPVEGTSPPIAGCLWETVPPPKTEDIAEPESNSSESQAVPQAQVTYRIVSPPYSDLEKEYGTAIMKGLCSPDVVNTFRQEAISIPQWTPWPETQHYATGPNGEMTWTVFPLCYCFPANDVSKRVWVEQTKQFCAQTCSILERVLGDRLRTALFSQLEPDTVLEAHSGWADLANHVLRLHIPLVVPSVGLCGTWVDGCVEMHREGHPILFDDSKIHRAFNYSPNESRIVLIVDLERPSRLPLGYATGGHSGELDKFIAQMGMPK